MAVDTDSSQIEKMLATFDHYIIMDDVEVANLSERWTALGIAGPRSRAVLEAAGIAIPETQPLEVFTSSMRLPQCNCLECTVVRGEDAQHESYEIWIASKDGCASCGKLWWSPGPRPWAARPWSYTA